MKVYVENGEVYFDYQGVDTQSGRDIRGSKARRFLLDTRCSWEKTSVPQVLKMEYKPYSFTTEYDQVKQFESYLKSCLAEAHVNDIELSEDFKELCVATARRCKELYEIEVTKEQARKAKSEWQRLCENGCSGCPNKARWNDDFVCKASGDTLEEKNIPGSVYGQHVLFNYVPFPSDKCPYKVTE